MSFSISDRHNAAHPERSDIKLVADLLLLHRVDSGSPGVREATRLLLVVMGKSAFNRIIDNLRRDDGHEFEPIDESQVRTLQRLWM